MGAGHEVSRAGTVPAAVAQVRDGAGVVVGAGFLVAEDLLVTCAHVLVNGGCDPGAMVELVFPHAPGAPAVAGRVLEDGWRDPQGQDIALVRLERAVGAAPLSLGSAAGCRGHRVRSFGFPQQAPPGGHFGFATAGGLLPAADSAGDLLQLTEANDLTTGFSGGPVLDEVTGLVVGMVAAITASDGHDRGRGIVYVTPASALRDVWPALAESDVSPYRGLEPFTAEHARWFRGREEAVRQVLAGLGGGRRAVLLLGPSGSGKSSLVQAGVLPALASGRLPGSDRWRPVVVRPGQDLPAALERAGLPMTAEEGIGPAVTRLLADDPAHDRVVLIIDQFEELLAHLVAGPECSDRGEDALAQITAAIDSSAALSVVIVMRDDFYSRLSALAPRLLQAALPGLLNVPSVLTHDELQAIITGPACDLGARFQPGLAEQIIADVLATDPSSAAALQVPVTALPLLEVALSRLWERRLDYDGLLTHDAYRRLGGVTGALATWCDSALAELDEHQRSIAQRILTALVRPASDTRHIPAVRQQVPLAELRALASGAGAPEDPHAVDKVLAVLTRHRIVTTEMVRLPGQDGVSPGIPVAELIHDALIRDWETLRGWLDQDSRFCDWLHRARAQQTRWQASGHLQDLPAGTTLTEGVEWARQRRLPADLDAFVTAGRQHQRVAIRRSRRINVILASVLALVLVASGLWQWQTALAERQDTLSRQLAAQSAAMFDTDPDLASLLAIAAYRTSPTGEATAALDAAADRPLRQRLVGHTGRVRSVSFSPDGRTLASGAEDGRVRLWDTTTNTTRAILTASSTFTEAPLSVAFSPDGHTLAAATYAGVRLWDIGTGTIRTTLTAGDNPVRSVAFSPDGKTLAAVETSSVRLWDTGAGTFRTLFSDDKTFDGIVSSVSFSPDGLTLATGSDSGRVRLWNTATGAIRTTLTGHDESAEIVAFSPDGRTLAASSGTAQMVRLWDTATGLSYDTLPVDGVTSMAFSPDGLALAAVNHKGALRLWENHTGTSRTIAVGLTDSMAVSFSPDGRTLATGSDSVVRLWNTATGTIRTTITDTYTRDFVVISSDGRTLASTDVNGNVQLRDTSTGAIRTTITDVGRGAKNVLFSSDGRTLASTDLNGNVQLRDTSTGAIRTTITDVGRGVVFSPDGRTLASTDLNGNVQLRDTSTGAVRTTLTSPHDVSGPLAYAPDGRTLAAATDNGTVRLWDTTTNTIRATLSNYGGMVRAVAFSPDGRTLAATGENGTVRLWDTATGGVRATLIDKAGTVYALAFGPDGHTLATAAEDGKVRLWDPTTGAVRSTFTGNLGPVYALAFGPDGHTLATAGGDGKVRLWDVLVPGPDTAITRICQALHRNITPEEQAAYLPEWSTHSICPS
ncbi:trypsin-like peptidase domain-containing protein [Kitasatospora sp. NPDC101235]|uniref:nSTAND1 domain-containing NTPase n=1 Tax=Kitasatospora sp. NPDC101235 TaxID=3364101 RepID=UPI0037F7AC6A